MNTRISLSLPQKLYEDIEKLRSGDIPRSLVYRRLLLRALGEIK
jgi:hypothetical protein